MFMNKKKAIASYLEGRTELTAFEELLGMYLSGALKSALSEMGIQWIAFHVDWLEHTKVLGIRGRYGKHRAEWRFDGSEFTFAVGGGRPGDDIPYSYSGCASARDVLDRMRGQLPPK